jgi:hypothetical protein
MAECRGANGKAPSVPPRTGQRDPQNYLGRY